MQAAFPLTKEKWKQMVSVLKAMRPSLLENDDGDENLEDP